MLSALYQSVQARRASHEALLSLSGRLELVRAQLDKAVDGAHTQMKLEPQACVSFKKRPCDLF